MISSYEHDIIASDGSILSGPYRFVVLGNICDVYDMRYETRFDRPKHYPNSQFVGLTQSRLDQIKVGNGFPAKIGRVWIGETGEWNVETKDKMTSIPTNRCLRLLNYGSDKTI